MSNFDLVSSSRNEVEDTFLSIEMFVKSYLEFDEKADTPPWLFLLSKLVSSHSSALSLHYDAIHQFRSSGDQK